MSEPSGNVIILGAGASFNAGIPLMSNFIDTMWNLARTGRGPEGAITPADRKILENALGVREDLDGYHGRASFDMWNIEDLLSILSFNAMAGGKKEKNRLEAITKGIAKTIEITCNVKHDGNIETDPEKGRNYLYEEFWNSLLKWSRDTKLPVPPIVTFNYDLVLERSLMRVLTGFRYFDERNKGFPWRSVLIRYGASAFDEVVFDAKFVRWETRGERYESNWGLKLSESTTSPVDDDDYVLRINLCKLHGSLNFPPSEKDKTDKPAGHRLVTALEDPLILPPVFNKATNSLGGSTWAEALRCIRACKNLIICGYSLPATDIYMQYFLKSALGPNQDLNRMFIYDRSLFIPEESAAAESLKNRYSAIFSPGIQHRIHFDPPRHNGGTFEDLVYILQKYPDQILFG